MKIIKSNKKVFIGVIIVAAVVAIIPTTLVYMFSQMSIGIEKEDSIEEIDEKINSYFDEGGFEKDIENAIRKKPSGDFNIYTYTSGSDESMEIEEKMNIICPKLIEVSRLELGKEYNIKLYSDFYEKDKQISTEEILSKDIVGTSKLQIIYGDTFMEGGSKRDMTIHIVQNNKILESAKYYCPTNYNEAAFTQDADLNINEDIPIMGFARGIKVNGKYKTYSADFHKSKDKIEKSIQNNLSKNEKMVILRLEISDRAKSI
ncbi:hypothetical protein [Romboutsia ilealis]|uniref:hypothetical protein n=1 Tax=Romboutsia ilealis TaxID=1115758 RepID=UPI002494CEFD|nr:hypothetical protein [Romboutsia ilealis]